MSIQGKIIVFTGKISKPRHEFEKLVVDGGGKFGTSVTSRTSYVVVGDKPGSKLARAVALGVETITEGDFITLLRDNNKEEIRSEVPLTSVNLEDQMEAAYKCRTKIIALNGFLDHPHLSLLECKWCRKNYQQWDDLPNYKTCPMCEMFYWPECPHCGTHPLFVEDFNLYCCMVCGTWFEAPLSVHARRTKHLHMWPKVSCTGQKITKRCVCGYAIHLELPEGTSYEDYRSVQKEEYDAAPEWVKHKRQEDAVLHARLEEEKRHEEWFDSLSDEQKDKLGRQLNVRT